MGKFDEGDEHLEHLLEASSQPASHRAWAFALIALLALAVVAFALLVTIDKRFACNVLGLRSFGCPRCDHALDGFCLFGQVCGVAKAQRGFDLFKGCFDKGKTFPCGENVCTTGMTCRDGKCLFSPICQPNDPGQPFPWRPNDWPPPSDTEFYDPDPKASASVYTKTISLLLRGPDQVARGAFDIANDDERVDTPPSGGGSIVYPEDALAAQFNLVGSLQYELVRPDGDTEAIWKPTSTSVWPMNGVTEAPLPGFSLPDVRTTVFGSSWASAKEKPYRYLIDQGDRGTESYVFGAYNVFDDNVGQPTDLRNSRFELQPRTTAVKLQFNHERNFVQLSLNNHLMGYAKNKPAERPWRIVRADGANENMGTDFCWTTVDDTPAQSGSDETLAPFKRVVLAAPMSGVNPTPDRRAFCSADQCVPVTWSLAYTRHDGGPAYDGGNLRKWSTKGDNPIIAMHATFALGKEACDAPEGSSQAKATHGDLTGSYDFTTSGLWTASGAQLAERCPFVTGCHHTCNQMSDAARTNCARDMNWIFHCEQPTVT